MKYSLYIHMPFCVSRCHYCDFITYTGQRSLMGEYVDALINELRIVKDQKPDLQFHSIYFGGGTPSLIPITLFSKLMERITLWFDITNDCEISIEANPNSLSYAYLHDLHKMGFNRLSLGVQSMNSIDLARLDRAHNIEDVLASMDAARRAGFSNLNIDLIFGLPWQDLAGWKASLSDAIKLKPEHFSVYSLIIEPGTPLFAWYQRGLIKTQDQDLEGDMYELTMNALNQAGFDQYEISNWAKVDPKHDYRCRHNLQYWLGYPYLGVGVGAHGFADGYRTVNTSTIQDYIKRNTCEESPKLVFPNTPSQISNEIIDQKTQMMDFMMVGLRLVQEGVSKERFSRLFNRSMLEVFRNEIELLLSQGLIEWTDRHQTNLHLTKRGIMVANQVFMVFV